MTLAVFNPWHDMALANGTPNYQPPRSALTMADELAHLSRLWEEEGRVTVWGWDPLVVHLLQKRGIPRHMMPTDEQLAAIRRLSSRQTAVKALAEFEKDNRFTSYWCTTEEEVWAALNLLMRNAQCVMRNGASPICTVKHIMRGEQRTHCAANYALRITHYALLKSPWSCSGKGLKKVSVGDLQIPTGHDIAFSHREKQLYGAYNQLYGAYKQFSHREKANASQVEICDSVSGDWLGWVRNVLRRQGGVVVEPFYEDKAQDFALEYEVRDGRARYLGLSLFATVGGTYTGNILDTEQAKRQRLGVPIDGIIDRHLAYINREIAPHYEGPLGIDLMLMSDGAVHPCVEINLRRTMGWVALQLERSTPLPAIFAIHPGQHYTVEVRPLSNKFANLV